MAGHSQTSLGRKRFALTLLQEQILPVSLQWRVKLQWATHHTGERRTGVAPEFKRTTAKHVQREAGNGAPAHRKSAPYTHVIKLTCWVQAFCSHSGLATGNPAAPLNWIENPGGAHWPAGRGGARWTALLLDLQYCQVLGVGGCPPPGPRWPTSEQLLLPLEEKNRKAVG